MPPRNRPTPEQPQDPGPTTESTRSAALPDSPNASGHPALVVRLPLPPLPSGTATTRLLWWGGLAAVAAIGWVSWPVAAVVGVGTVVAEQLGRDGARPDEPPTDGQEREQGRSA